MAAGGSCFFYGTLVAREILYRVIYGTTTDKQLSVNIRMRPALLHNHCRRRVRGVDYPALVVEQDKKAQGTLVEGLTKADIYRLDLFEGDEYLRVQAKVEVLVSDDNATEETETYTYLWNGHPTDLLAEEWDFDHFMKEKLRRWISDDKEYVDCDQADPLGNRWWGNGFSPEAEAGLPDVKSEQIKSAV